MKSLLLMRQGKNEVDDANKILTSYGSAMKRHCRKRNLRYTNGVETPIASRVKGPTLKWWQLQTTRMVGYRSQWWRRKVGWWYVTLLTTGHNTHPSLLQLIMILCCSPYLRLLVMLVPVLGKHYLYFSFFYESSSFIRLCIVCLSHYT